MQYRSILKGYAGDYVPIGKDQRVPPIIPIIGEPDACGGVLALLETVRWHVEGFANVGDIIIYIKTCMQGIRGNAMWR